MFGEIVFRREQQEFRIGFAKTRLASTSWSALWRSIRPRVLRGLNNRKGIAFEHRRMLRRMPQLKELRNELDIQESAPV